MTREVEKARLIQAIKASRTPRRQPRLTFSNLKAFLLTSTDQTANEHCHQRPDRTALRENCAGDLAKCPA